VVVGFWPLTVAPSRAKAVADPMPLVEPVMSTVFLDRHLVGRTGDIMLDDVRNP
jgi:hypothetical protein